MFDAAQLNALVLFFLNLHKADYLIAQVFFGLWSLPLGYLVYKSGFLPKIVGALLIVACFGYLVDVVTFSLFPTFDIILSEFIFIGEPLLLAWLLVKGVNVEQWQARAVEPDHVAPAPAS